MAAIPQSISFIRPSDNAPPTHAPPSIRDLVRRQYFPHALVSDPYCRPFPPAWESIRLCVYFDSRRSVKTISARPIGIGITKARLASDIALFVRDVIARRMQEWQHDEAAADDQEVADVDRRYRQARRAFDSNGRLLRLMELRRTGDAGNVPTYKVVLIFD